MIILHMTEALNTRVTQSSECHDATDCAFQISANEQALKKKVSLFLQICKPNPWLFAAGDHP